MTDLISIRAFLLLPRSSNITTQFTLETPYGLIVELKSGEKLNVRLKDNPSTSAAKAQDAPDSAPEILPDAQPKDSHESLSELNLNSDTASDQDHSHMGLAYSISTDYGTSGLWYEAGWPGNGSEYDFHIYLEELEDRYPAAWLQAFARWIEQYDDSFEAGECHLSSQGVLFPDLEERKAWSVEGALLAAWLALQEDVDHVSFAPFGTTWELQREDLGASLAEAIYCLTDGLDAAEESEDRELSRITASLG